MPSHTPAALVADEAHVVVPAAGGSSASFRVYSSGGEKVAAPTVQIGRSVGLAEERIIDAASLPDGDFVFLLRGSDDGTTTNVLARVDNDGWSTLWRQSYSTADCGDGGETIRLLRSIATSQSGLLSVQGQLSGTHDVVFLGIDPEDGSIEWTEIGETDGAAAQVRGVTMRDGAGTMAHWGLDDPAGPLEVFARRTHSGVRVDASTPAFSSGARATMTPQGDLLIAYRDEDEVVLERRSLDFQLIDTARQELGDQVELVRDVISDAEGRGIVQTARSGGSRLLISSDPSMFEWSGWLETASVGVKPIVAVSGQTLYVAGSGHDGNGVLRRFDCESIAQ